MEIQSQEKILLLGASSGLGKAVHEALKARHEKLEIVSYSRKIGGMDFAKRDRWQEYVDKIWSHQPKRLIYFAGGGPYGEYKNFEWKDHDWALNVSFSFPAFLLHSALRLKNTAQYKSDALLQLQQIIFIGSEIAESKPDPKASMYCAAKHALRGLISSVQVEEPRFDLRLFSPGYMDTPMLPAQSWPRQKGLAQKVDKVALDLINFMTRQAPKSVSATLD